MNLIEYTQVFEFDCYREITCGLRNWYLQNALAPYQWAIEHRTERMIRTLLANIGKYYYLN